MTESDLTIFLHLIQPDNRTWQTFDDRRLGDGHPRRSRSLSRVLNGSLAGVEAILRRLNAPEVGAGVYITANPTDGFGRRTRNISRIATVVGDMDNGLPPGFPLAPTITIETSPGKFQCWWTIDHGSALTPTEHADILARLVADYFSDRRATGIARVYRVPGFWHLKGPPFLVRISGGTLRAIDKSSLLAAFPPLPSPTPILKPARFAPLHGSGSKMAGLDRFVGPLQAISADDYSTWITIGLALHAESGGGTDGLAMWDAWSANSPKYWPGECAARWATFQPPSASRATGGKIIWLAERHGWRRLVS